MRSTDASRIRSRAYGQNYLVSEGVSSKIVETFLGGLKGGETILEIGPGEGALTLRLPRPITLAEMDPELIAKWKPLPGVSIIEGNAVDTLPPWLAGRTGPVAVVSNLPYNASTAILSSLLGASAKIPLMILMFQKEVAQKLRASPGDRDVGPLSLLTQALYDLSRVMTVAPGSFKPKPNVDSEVICLLRRAEPRVTQAEWQNLRELAFAAFKHRRKMLRHNLPNAPTELLGLRPHELTWQDWQTLLELQTK